MGKLFFRLPGEAKQSVKGEFIELHPAERSSFEGFVVATANGDRWFGFVEGREISQRYEMATPFVVTKEMYLQQAHFFVEEISKWGFGKAVLSRVKAVQGINYDNEVLFDALERNYPNAFCYVFESAVLGTWMAATPEILVKQNGDTLETMALAGTRTAHSNIPWEEKEYQEQGLVTTYIKAVFDSFDRKPTVGEREEFVAGPVKHLLNRFHCDFPKEQLHDLVDLLHPTPAVSGLPLEEAQQLIARVEAHQRLFYSGIVGWQAPDKSTLFVNLRCAQKKDDNLFLYVGGGLTKDSQPELEWQETENKAKTLLNVFVEEEKND